jgi:RNA-directed DNA polymerase
VVASEVFSRIDRYVDEQLWRMLHRRYPKKSKAWLCQKYWGIPGHKGVFSATGKTKKGKRLYPVIRLSSLGIQRYIKVKADANPYLPGYGRYFWRRRHDKASRLLPALPARRVSGHDQIVENQQPGHPTRVSFVNAWAAWRETVTSRS